MEMGGLTDEGNGCSTDEWHGVHDQRWRGTVIVVVGEDVIKEQGNNTW